jgi:hypothetical protein
MHEGFADAEDMQAVALVCAEVIAAHLRRSPNAKVGTINELDALDRLRDTLRDIDREKVGA